MSYRILQVAPQFDDDEIQETLGALGRNWITEGPCAAEFLETIKRETGSRHAVLAPNGTLGLYLALLAMELPRDSEILIPSFTFFGSASAAVFAGLTPVFVDADYDTLNLDVDRLAAHVSPRTRAIMPVHMYGHAAPMDRVIEFAHDHDLLVIEDAAQGYGVSYRERHTGTWGDVGVISFFADKTVTTGEGGVVLTQRDDLFERLSLLRNQGRHSSGSFIHPSLGMNFRVTDLQCAVGLAQLRKLPGLVEKKLANYELYRRGLEGIPGTRLMRIQADSTFVPFRFVLGTEAKTAVTAALESGGVQTRSVFYPLHLQPSLTKYAHGPLPAAERIYEEGIALPIHAELAPTDIDYISEVIRGAVTSSA